MENERTKTERERLALETELETVRNRAAEMAETLDEQRRQMAEGSLVRGYAHGQPYWAKKDEAA